MTKIVVRFVRFIGESFILRRQDGRNARVTSLPLCLSSTSCTLEAARRSSLIVWPLFRSISPKESTPVGQDCTHALHRTHSGSAIGMPLLAKFITSIPWWQTDVQTLQEMHFFLSARMRKREKRA